MTMLYLLVVHLAEHFFARPL